MHPRTAQATSIIGMHGASRCELTGVGVADVAVVYARAVLKIEEVGPLLQAQPVDTTQHLLGRKVGLHGELQQRFTEAQSSTATGRGEGGKGKGCAGMVAATSCAVA